MRKIVEKTEDGEKTTLVFASPQEREDFFSQAEKKVKDQQLDGTETLRKAYMDAVKKVDEAYLRALGELRAFRENCLLESEIRETPPA